MGGCLCVYMWMGGIFIGTGNGLWHFYGNQISQASKETNFFSFTSICGLLWWEWLAVSWYGLAAAGRSILLAFIWEFFLPQHTWQQCGWIDEWMNEWIDTRQEDMCFFVWCWPGTTKSDHMASMINIVWKKISNMYWLTVNTLGDFYHKELLL